MPSPSNPSCSSAAPRQQAASLGAVAAGAAALQGGEALQGGSGEGQAGGRPPPRTPPTPAAMHPKEDPHSTKTAAVAAGQVPGALLHGSSDLPEPLPLQPAAGWCAKAAAAAMA